MKVALIGDSDTHRFLLVQNLLEDNFSLKAVQARNFDQVTEACSSRHLDLGMILITEGLRSSEERPKVLLEAFFRRSLPIRMRTAPSVGFVYDGEESELSHLKGSYFDLDLPFPDSKESRKAFLDRLWGQIGDRYGKSSFHEVEITRFPRIHIRGKISPGHELTITVDLQAALRQQSAPKKGSSAAEDHGWSQLAVRTVLTSPHLLFNSGRNLGMVMISPNGLSDPFITSCMVASPIPSDLNQICICASFYQDGRFCGIYENVADLVREMPVAGTAGAQVKLFGLQERIVAPHDKPDPNYETLQIRDQPPVPRTTSMKDASSPENVHPKPVYIPDAAPSPFLTVQIFHHQGTPVGELVWIMMVSDAVLEKCELPDSNIGYTSLGNQPELFVQNLLQQCESVLRGDHFQFFLGVGKRIWELVPEEFRKIYTSMRNRYGAGFPIQFVTDEPYIPWELMLAEPYGDDPEHPFLSQLHPVGRWLQRYANRRWYHLKPGQIATVAPRYDRGGPPPPLLPQAQQESAQILAEFSGMVMPVVAEKKQVLDLLMDKKNQPISIFHFAGHGDATVSEAELSRILLEYRQGLTALEVRTPNILLGLRYRTLAFFNACRVGQTNRTLGVVGGWAEALTERGFGGFIAPLWAIYDDDAALVSTSFIRSIVANKQEIAEALRKIRYDFGDRSPTYLSYVYYGDVRAQFV